MHAQESLTYAINKWLETDCSELISALWIADLLRANGCASTWLVGTGKSENGGKGNKLID